MSHYESHKGKLVKIKENMTKEEMEHFAKTELIHKNVKIPDYYENVLEFIRDNTDKYPYFFGENSIYEIENYALDPDNDEFWYQNKGEEVEYSFRFYNGGTCLEEQVQELIKILERNLK